ncbi:MAG: phage shock protein operon transcriptional activator [Desulfobacter sp.]|nr:phage shock protein operon transcriptional activator [Desulfobacter sp.]
MNSQVKSVSMSEALGQSEVFLEFQEKISRVAPIERPVLILGERGTGKELAAARLHFLSKRWQKPLVTLNCAALTPSLIGSELFGYEKGAFTGAATRHKGRFEQAADGTLFLDEIGNIPMEVQEKILRVVEYGSFERVGASSPVQVDVRIVGAANMDLSLMVDQGRFKQDLLDRLSFEVIYVPPLRCRKGDILLLANHFASRMAFELGRKKVPEIISQAVKSLESHAWPGNVRELKNVVERAVYKSMTHEISDIAFDPFFCPYGTFLGTKKNGPEPAISKPDSPELPVQKNAQTGLDIKELREKPLKEAVLILERYRFFAALSDARFNQKKAAALLGLSYDQFRGLKKKHGI